MRSLVQVRWQASCDWAIRFVRNEKGGGGSGKLVETGYQLAPPETAKTARASGVTDGPFMETKEALGGYSVLETDTIEEAVEIAKTWPGVDRGWMTVEVRPVVEM